MTAASSAQPGARLPDADEAAAEVFGARLALAERYARTLADVATTRGLIGPREVSRLWARHLVNSAVVTELLPAGARVIDVGSGAGLPGIPMAIRRPDLSLVLLDPMLRRTQFLEEIVADLELSNVTVVRGRAEERGVASGWVVARAVAPLDRLVGWTLPLVGPDACLLAMKGAGAVEELATHRRALESLGARDLTVHELGPVGSPTWVVSLRPPAVVARQRKGRR